MSPQWGGPFYLGRLGPREMSLAIWGLKGKGSKDKGYFPLSQITAQRDSPIKYNQGEGTCFRDKTTIKLVNAIMVNTS
jgi:hypothetical protein